MSFYKGTDTTKLTDQWSQGTFVKSNLYCYIFKNVYQGGTSSTEKAYQIYGIPYHSFKNDTWRTFVAANIWDSGSKQLSCVAKGYFPTFKRAICVLTPGTYKMYRITSGLKIGSSAYNLTNFHDNVAPFYVLIAVQAPGGGGGGTWGSDDGTGGGAGGFQFGAVEVGPSSSNYTEIRIDSGGAGGYKKQTTTIAGGGATGGTAKVTRVYSSSASTYILYATGGGGGRASTKKEAYAGGAGGKTGGFGGDIVADCNSGCKGGQGGKVYKLSNATGTSKMMLHASSYTGYEGSSLSYEIPATSGGAQGDNNAPGGGGGSKFANGPVGAGYTSDGKAGSQGAGGSGARYTFAVYKRGGAGGDGLAKIWY